MISTNFYIPPLLKLKKNLDLTVDSSTLDFDSYLTNPFRIQIHTNQIRTAKVNSNEVISVPFNRKTQHLNSFIVKDTGFLLNLPKERNQTVVSYLYE